MKTTDPGGIILMRAIGLMMVIAAIGTGAWVFVPFAVAYMFRDIVGEFILTHISERRRGLIRFAQYRLMGSAVASLVMVTLYQAGTVTVIFIFVVAWIDVILRLLSKPKTITPLQLPVVHREMTVTRAASARDRISRP